MPDLLRDFRFWHQLQCLSYDWPAGDGQAMVSCITLALKDANVLRRKLITLMPRSSTRMNDIFETSAYKTVFVICLQLPASSFKSMIGHPLAAANAVELTICSMIFQKNILPPRLIRRKRPLCDLDYIPNVARAKKINTMIKTRVVSPESTLRWYYGDINKCRAV